MTWPHTSAAAPHLAFVLPTGFDVGGVVTWSLATSHHLAAAGARATVISHQGDGGLAGADEPGWNLLVSAGKSAWHATSDQDLAPFVAAYRQVLPAVLIPNWSLATYGACARLSETDGDRLRVIGVCHTDEPDYYACLEYYEPIIQTFIAVSADIDATLRARLPRRAADMFTRPCGVDVPPTLRRTYSAPGAPLRLAYAGRLESRQKRVRDLIALAEALVRARVPFELRIAGTGPDADWLRDAAVRFTEGSALVRVLGAVPHDAMRDLWRWADVCVLVSNYEGTSVSMLEAMAAGCVPVVTNVSGTAAVLDAGANGITIPVGDIASFVDRLTDLAAHRARLAEMGAQAHRTVRDRYSVDAYAPWLLELASRAMAMPPRRWPAGRPLRHRESDPPKPPSLGDRVAGRLRRLMGS